VPNAASLQARLFGDRWLALDLPRHLVHISPPALLSQVEALGFRVERVSYLRGGQVLFGWLHGIVGRLPGHPDLYDAIRRGQARQAGQAPSSALPLSPRAWPRFRSPSFASSSRWRPVRRNRLRRGPALTGTCR
jgi:hypothetical protein